MKSKDNMEKNMQASQKTLELGSNLPSQSSNRNKYPEHMEEEDTFLSSPGGIYLTSILHPVPEEGDYMNESRRR